MIEQVILSKQGSVNWWLTFLRLQVLWRLIGSVIACNCVVFILLIVDPLCLYGGRWLAPGDMRVIMDGAKQQVILDMLRAPHWVGLILNGALLLFIAIMMEKAYQSESRQHFHPEHETVFSEIIKYVLIVFTILAPVCAVVGLCWFRHPCRHC